MSEFTLERDVPIPPRTGGGRGPKYPWATIQVGESFFVPVKDGGNVRNLMVSLRGAARRHFPSTAITTRSVVEGGVVGVRLWRVQ